jgi:hypothetical protein
MSDCVINRGKLYTLDIGCVLLDGNISTQKQVVNCGVLAFPLREKQNLKHLVIRVSGAFKSH